MTATNETRNRELDMQLADSIDAEAGRLQRTLDSLHSTFTNGLTQAQRERALQAEQALQLARQDLEALRFAAQGGTR